MKSLFTKLVFLLFIPILFQSALRADYNRKVVFEEFSEVWCGPCASLAPMLSKWLDNHSDYIPIFYYSYLKIGTAIVTYSKDDYYARSDFYSVPFYPYARVNAVNCPNDSYSGYPTDTNRINAIIDTMSKNTPIKIEIDFTNNVKTGNVTVNVTSDIGLSNKKLFIMLVDKHYTYQQQANGQTEFHDIMRKMLPTGNGTTFSISAGETKEFTFDYTMDFPMNYDLYAVAMVQDESTKYIYQTESVFKSNPNAVEETSEVLPLQLSPNPATDYLEIALPGSTESIEKIEIYDLLGELINSLDIQKDAVRHISIQCIDQNSNQLNPAQYIIMVETSKKRYMDKLIIIK